MRVEEIVTVDVTKKKESRKLEQQEETEMMEGETVKNVDWTYMTMLKLNKGSKGAFSQRGNLYDLLVPDAFFETIHFVFCWEITLCSANAAFSWTS